MAPKHPRLHLDERTPPRRRKNAGRNTTLVVMVVVLIVAVGAAYYLGVIAGSSKTQLSSGTNNSNSTSGTTSATTSTQAGTFSTIVVGGSKPPGSVMGDLIDLGNKSGTTSVNLQSAPDEGSIRFTSPSEGSAVKITINTQAVSGTPSLTVRLEADVDGVPSGVTLGGPIDYATISISSDKTFITAQLPYPIPLHRGSIYHVVLAPTNGSQGVAAVIAYSGISPYQPLNATDPDINWKDGSINTLFFTEGRWQVQNHYPVFIITLQDGSSFGQPYSLAAPWYVSGPTYVGETIIPAYSYNVGKIAFFISKQGSPEDKLYYAVYDSSNIELASGTFATPQEVNLTWGWREIQLPSPVDLHAGRLYRVVLYSHGTTVQNNYQVIGHEFSDNYLLGYGGLQQRLVVSLDAGHNWADWNDADCVFRLTVAG